MESEIKAGFNEFFTEEKVNDWIKNNICTKFTAFGEKVNDVLKVTCSGIPEIKEDVLKKPNKSGKINWKCIIIISIIALVVIVSPVLILRFALGSKENKADQNNPEGNNNNNEGGNTNTPSQNENGSKTKQGSGIFEKSLVTLTGTAGGIGAKFAADKVLGHGKQDGNNEKGEKGQKNRDGNGPYTYVDSTGKVISKAEGKDSSDNIEDANTDVSDTEQPETLNSTEGKGVRDNVENADPDVSDNEQAETSNEFEKIEKTEEENGKN